jgi:hypothetical protein
MVSTQSEEFPLLLFSVVEIELPLKWSASVSSSAPTGPDKRRKVFVPKASGPKKPHQKGCYKGAKKPGSR